MTIKINKNPNIGIKIFTILPIPFFTPAETIKKVKSIKTVCQNKRLYGEAMTAPNWSDELKASEGNAAIKI